MSAHLPSPYNRLSVTWLCKQEHDYKKCVIPLAFTKCNISSPYSNQIGKAKPEGARKHQIIQTATWPRQHLGVHPLSSFCSHTIPNSSLHLQNHDSVFAQNPLCGCILKNKIFSQCPSSRGREFPQWNALIGFQVKKSLSHSEEMGGGVMHLWPAYMF